MGNKKEGEERTERGVLLGDFSREALGNYCVSALALGEVG